MAERNPLELPPRDRRVSTQLEVSDSTDKRNVESDDENVDLFEGVSIAIDEELENDRAAPLVRVLSTNSSLTLANVNAMLRGEGNQLPQHYLPQFQRVPNASSTLTPSMSSSMVISKEPPFLVPGVISLAALMCIGVIVVGLAGFLPIYFVEYNAISATVRGMRRSAVNGVLRSSYTSLMQLPTLLSTIAANFMINQTSDESWIPENKTELMFILNNVVSKNLSNNRVAYLYMMSAAEGWLVVGAKNDTITGHCGAAPCQGGGLILNNVSSPLWEVSPVANRFTRDPPLALTSWSLEMSRSTTRSGDSFQSIAVPWRNSDMEGSPSPIRWNTRDIDYSGFYFDFVLPTYRNNSLGFIEAAFRKADLLPSTDSGIVIALRHSARFMITDAANDIVLETSWNQPVRIQVTDRGTTNAFEYLKTSGVNDPTMKHAIDAVNSRGGFAAVMYNQSMITTQFKSNGEKYVLSIGRLRDSRGLDLFISIATRDSDFFKSTIKTRNIVVSVIVIVVVLVAVFAFFGMYWMLRPLRDLIPALKKASSLEVAPEGEVYVNSFIKEIWSIQQEHAKLVSQLSLLRSYVPEAVLARIGRQGSTDTISQFGATLVDVAEEEERGLEMQMLDRQSQVDQQEAPSIMDAPSSPVDNQPARFVQETTEHPTKKGSEQQVKVRTEPKLKGKIFTEKLNTFTPKFCTVLVVECALHTKIDKVAITAYFDTVVRCVAENHGCIEAMRPDRTTVSFGAHTPLPLHASKACACALAIHNSLSESDRQNVVISVDSAEFLVGTCGAYSRNARVLFGIQNFSPIMQVQRVIGCHLGATNGTATQLQAVQLYPVDCILLPDSSETTVIYELRPEPDATADAQRVARQTCDRFRQGLSAMRRGDYNAARSTFQKIGHSDPQGRRLLRECLARIKDGDSTPYVRRIEETYETSEGTGDQGGLNQADYTGPVTQEELNRLRGRTQTVIDELISQMSKRSANHSSFGNDSGALFAMVAMTPTDSDVDEFASDQEKDGDDVPLTFIDHAGTRWSRSFNKISDGAFGVVYLGMSEEGEQVALKCIPRRRRDVSGESLASEVEVASKLRHPNIVRYISYCEDPGYLTLVMEYVPGGSLHGVIASFGKLTATAARRFMTDVLRGLQHLHSRGIVHCDVKPHNVLLGMDGVCKLTDFGSTITEATDRACAGSEDVLLRGTAMYMAPEVARGDRCTPQSDIFSLGVSLVEMLTGQLPWVWTERAAAGVGPDDLTILIKRDAMFAQALGRGEVAVSVPDDLEPDVRAFAQACCQLDPAKRPSVLQLQSYAFLL